jgi:hypothetical protein
MERTESEMQSPPLADSSDVPNSEVVSNEAVESNGLAHKRKKQMKRREDQFVVQTLKTLADVEDPEEKLRTLARKLFQSNDECRQSQVSQSLFSLFTSRSVLVVKSTYHSGTVFFR